MVRVREPESSINCNDWGRVGREDPFEFCNYRLLAAASYFINENCSFGTLLSPQSLTTISAAKTCSTNSIRNQIGQVGLLNFSQPYT